MWNIIPLKSVNRIKLKEIAKDLYWEKKKNIWDTYINKWYKKEYIWGDNSVPIFTTGHMGTIAANAIFSFILFIYYFPTGSTSVICSLSDKAIQTLTPVGYEFLLVLSIRI